MDFLFEFFSSTALALLGALILDRWLGEPQSWHPLIWFGNWANYYRRTWQVSLSASSSLQRLNGVMAWSLAVLPCAMVLTLILWMLPSWLEWLLGTVVLYFTIGWQSLREHALAIAKPLHDQDLPKARAAVGRIVSRDTSELDETQIAKASMESVLENGSDAVFAPIFWFLVLGPFGAILYRLSNTLDAMWGYKKPDLLHFGWCAARIDDVLNFIPARLVVLTYALFGNSKRALHCAWHQGRGWKSPNAGPVMAAGAGALQVSLGGTAIYFGEAQQRPALGEGPDPKAGDLDRAVELVDKGVYLWALLILVLI
ncbi:adenosylcobinamide-phosphate synthase CbiB [Marinomonas ostreistagni]|uniref:Cobalamin biosynthesis protein CobD n=1 Tax=Marinomonas ostreistagni TaxID=359209 RepID=A0ABS0ZD08_9GAMM|nr:adenosylcobinamide-phosphate synthase CbiB [Marinomonas ostreistagni]MBJ7551548.1 cobalamin biosynthesis protein [Marinomonas ostreistagni]